MIPASWLAATAAHAGYDAVLAEAIGKYQPGLTLPDAPETYHVRYQLLTLQQVDVRTSMGSLVSESSEPFHALGVEIRVGTPAFDNTGFGGWQNGSARATLPEVLTEEALRAELWRTTDRAYKEAVEQYARKQSQFEAPKDWPGDYTLTGATTADRGEARGEAAPDRLRALALAAGAELATPEALLAEVHVGHEAGSLWIVDSEGTRVHTPVEETSVRVMLQVRADDGSLLTDHRLFTSRGVDDLPDDQELLAAVRRLREGLLAAAKAPVWAEEYVGPVVFEDAAATDLYRYLLVSQLEGTPAEIPFDSFFGDLGSSQDPVRVGRRVLPMGWTVVDDPTSVPSHPGSYEYDQEGTKTRELKLVEDGIVRTLAMSRVPRRGLTETNGHGRGMVGDRVSGRLSLYTVTPDRSVSDVKLTKTAARVARSYDRDWWVVVRRLQEPAVLGYDTDYWFDQAETPLPPPVQVVKRWADGREEVFRGARMSGVQRWLLRDIVAAGRAVETDYLAPLVPGDWGGMRPTEGVVSRAKGPVVLVGEVEIVPDPGDPMEVPVIPPPAPAVRAPGVR
jgi:predicted Zn-dependent protease